jgi:hypothetical protein
MESSIVYSYNFPETGVNKTAPPRYFDTLHQVLRLGPALDMQALYGVAPARYSNNETLSQSIGDEIGLNVFDTWELAVKIAYYIGRFDSLCGNCVHWGLRVISGNLSVIQEVLPRMELLSEPAQRFHPDFRRLNIVSLELTEDMMHTARHFTALCIPLITLVSPVELRINWPSLKRIFPMGSYPEYGRRTFEQCLALPVVGIPPTRLSLHSQEV